MTPNLSLNRTARRRTVRLEVSGRWLAGAGLIGAAGRLLGACVYDVQPTAAPPINISSSYCDRIPGKWAVVVDDGVKGLRRDVKSSIRCSAHTYSIDAGPALTTSIRQTLENVFEETVAKEALPSQEVLASERLAGSVWVRLNQYQPRLACPRAASWSGGVCDSTVDLSLGIIVKGSDGQDLVATSFGSTQSAVSEPSNFCGKAGSAVAGATGRAITAALSRLTDTWRIQWRFADRAEVE